MDAAVIFIENKSLFSSFEENKFKKKIEYAEISIVLTIARTISYRHLSIAISSLWGVFYACLFTLKVVQAFDSI